MNKVIVVGGGAAGLLAAAAAAEHGAQGRTGLLAAGRQLPVERRRSLLP